MSRTRLALVALLVVVANLGPSGARAADEAAPRPLDEILTDDDPAEEPEPAVDAGTTAPAQGAPDAGATDVAPTDPEPADAAATDEPPADCPACPDCPPCRTTREVGEVTETCLHAQLSALVKAPPLVRPKVGVVVARLHDGAVVYAHRGERALVPASASKVVTAAAALHHMGPSHRFKTEIFSDRRRDGVVEGNLYIQGHGDPTLDTGTLLAMALELRERGIRRVTGDIVVDGTAFDDERLPPAFDTKETDAAFRAATAALAVERAQVHVAAYPGRANGSPCRVELGLGAGYFDIVNHCLSVGGKSDKWTLSADVSGERTRLTVGGRVGLSIGRLTATRRVEHPLLHAAHAFREALIRVGIQVDGGARASKMPRKRIRLVRHSSAPLAVILAQMNKTSDNFIAEMVLKALGGAVGGRPATWSKGQRAVRRYLSSFEGRAGTGPTEALFAAELFDEGAYTFLNGSGLYDANLLSPFQIARILFEAVHDPETGAEFSASLAIAARDGTLRRRLKETPAARRARAKTGTLNGVDALAGLVTARDGETYLFVFLSNGSKVTHRTMRDAFDRMVAVIATGC